EQHRAHAHPGHGHAPGAARELVLTAQAGEIRQPGGRAAQAAGEEVAGDLPGPRRLLDDRLSVVGARLGQRRCVRLGHRGPPKTAAASPTPRTMAALPAAAQIDPRSWTVSTG